MDLYMFPFDCQNLQIIVKPNKKDISQVVLTPGEAALNKIPATEWAIVGNLCRTDHTDPSTSTAGKVYSSMHIIMLVQRESGWYVKNIIFPTVSMVALNCTVYAFPLHEIGSRMEIAVGLVLATAINKIAVHEKLARISYQTFIDRFQSACFYFQVWVGFSLVPIKLTASLDPTAGFWLNIALLFISFLWFITMCLSLIHI